MKITITLLLLCIMFGCWAWSVSELYQSWRFLSRAKTATGRVVDYVMEERSYNPGAAGIKTGPRDSDNKVMAGSTFPVVAFTAEDGKSYSFEAKTSASYVPSADVSVLYLPEDPSQARLNTFSELWIEAIAGAVLGLFALIGLFIFRRFSA